MNDYQVLRENILFSDLSDHDLKKLLEISRRIDVEQGYCFLHEGDIAKEFYFILEGRVAVIKLDSQQQQEHVIAHIDSGNAIGEIALLDKKPRSASVKAELPTKLLSISFKELERLAEKSPSFNKIIVRIAENVGGRIRETNTAVVEALEKQISEYKMQTGLGLFMVNIIVALCLFAYILSWATQREAGEATSSIIAIPVTTGFLLLFLIMMKTSKLPLRIFGLTTRYWRRAFIEAVVFSFILCGAVVCLKWLFVYTTVRYAGHPIFEPFLNINLKPDTSNIILTVALYWLIVIPMQELMVRGGLQSPLELFLTGRYVKAKAIVISNLMFSIILLVLSFELALLAFFAGLYFGWLYSRNHTLIGVIVAHIILGTWAFNVVGFYTGKLFLFC